MMNRATYKHHIVMVHFISIYSWLLIRSVPQTSKNKGLGMWNWTLMVDPQILVFG